MRGRIAGATTVLLAIAAACSGLDGLAGERDDGGSSCPPGSGDCDGNKENGCETRTNDNTSHCGACANLCPTRANALPTCVESKCGVSCNAGFADCNADPADGCETRVDDDPRNCGACAHDCLGTECRAGLCRPEMLASAQGSITAFALASTRILFTAGNPSGTPNQIRVIDKGGGTTRPVVTGNVLSVYYLAADDSHVYFTPSQQMMRCLIDAPLPCNVTNRLESYGPQPGPFTAVEVQGGFVYNAYFHEVQPNVIASSIAAFPKDAAAPDATTFAGRIIQSNIPEALGAIAVDRNEIFYGGGLGSAVTKTAIVYRHADDAGAIYSNQGAIGTIFAIGFDADLVAWAVMRDVDAEIYTCPRAGCTTPEKIGTLMANTPSGIAIAGPHVYVAAYGTTARNFEDGAVVRFPRTGNAAPVVLADKQRGVTGLEQDPTHLYWANRIAGEIYRVAK